MLPYLYLLRHLKFCSDADPKGSDCYDAFKTMQECFSRYPTVYNKTGDDNDNGDSKGDTSSEQSFPSSSINDKNAVETVDQLDETDDQRQPSK